MGGLGIRPAKNGRRAFAIAGNGNAPAFTDLTDEDYSSQPAIAVGCTGACSSDN